MSSTHLELSWELWDYIRGRSLRDFDLQTRLFRYPLSYLIYSKSFDALPAGVKTYVYRRLREILSGEDKSKDFAYLSVADRSAILEIANHLGAAVQEQHRAHFHPAEIGNPVRQATGVVG